jgi:hypothetical protein
MRTYLLRLIALSLLCAMATFAEPSDAPWPAQWIGPEHSTTNLWLCYRKDVTLSARPASLPARIAVDSKYWLWINGKMVIFEGGLKRGPTPQDTYYDEVDIGPHLKRGKNTIALLVWYFGKSGFSHNSSGQAGLIFDAENRDCKILSDNTWRVIVHPAYGTAEGERPNYRLAESNIRFDARLDIGDWTARTFDDSAWPAPKEFGIPPVAPWNNLEKRPIPQWKNSGLVSYVRVESTTNVDGSQLVTAHLPYNAQVTPYLKVTAPAGQKIDIQTDDYKGGGAPNVRCVYITRGGVQEFESLGWMNGHEVHYTAPASVKFLEVKYRETGYNASFVGEFRCSDEALNTLWEKARRTLYVTMRDNYMDCPDRERAQWWGDAVNEIGESFYVFDPANGPLLARKAIRELTRWQRDDGTLYSPVPAGKPKNDLRKDPGSGNWNSELPPQMLASVSWYGFWTYYIYSGDRQTITNVYPHVRDYLNVWKLDSNGLVIHRKGDWDWEDWGENIDAAVMDNAWYYLALRGATSMAQITGHREDADKWWDLSGVLWSNFNANFWTGSEYRSKNYHGDTDDRANALATVAGLAETNKYAKLRDVFANHFNASPYMEKYALEALYKMNLPEDAMGRMKKRWKSQIDSPLTTLWEMWGKNGKGGGTYNHAWSGGVLTALSEHAAGIQHFMCAMGADYYIIKPQLGSLTFLHSVVPTRNGAIRLDIKRNPGELDFDLELPVIRGGTAVDIPQFADHPITRIDLDGKTVWAPGLENSHFTPIDGYINFWPKSRKLHLKALTN